MFFTDDYLNKSKITKLQMQATTFNHYYVYWRDQLFERVMRLFVWENTYSMDDDGKVIGIKPKEIEQRLIISGHCGITNFKNELTAFFGSFYGVTKYQDEWTNYTVHCPVYTGKRTIGKDIVVIDNNALRNPIYPLIDHYAQMLAHAEITLIDAMVNIRDNNGIPVVQNENQRQSVLNYKGKLWNGQFDVVQDPAFLGVDFKTVSGSAGQLTDLINAKKNILNSFYSDIGVRSAFEKKSNTVESEVEADTSLLLLNLSDMLASRELGAEMVNNMYGTNWTVHIAEEIDYGLENDPEERSVEHVEDN